MLIIFPCCISHKTEYDDSIAHANFATNASVVEIHRKENLC